MIGDGLHLIDRSELRPAAWKNGAGTTTELAIGPVHDGRPLWRFSIATLTDDASRFSTFPGMDRVFTIVGVHGVRLDFAAESLDARPWVPIAFSGAEGPICTPGGDTAAFNVMVDRTRATANVVLHDLTERSMTIDSSTATLVYVRSGRATAGSVDTVTGQCLLVRNKAVTLAGKARILLARVALNNTA
jgi:environmental stress-induced protein Ves